MKSVLKKLFDFVKPYLFTLIFSLICSIISVLAALYVPILIGDAIDYMTGVNEVNTSSILLVLIKLVITIGIYALFTWLLGISTNSVAFKTIKDIRVAAFTKLQKVPLKYIDSHPHGDIISRTVGDVEHILMGLLQGFTQLFTGIITILGTIIFMLYKNVTLAIVVIILTPMSLFVASFIAKRTSRMFRKTAITSGELSSHIEEMVTNQKLIKTFNYEEESIRQFNTLNNELHKWNYKGQFYSALTNPSTRFVNSIVYALVGVIGAILVIKYTKIDSSQTIFTIGAFSCFLSYATQYTKPFNEVSGVVTELSTAYQATKRVFDIIELDEVSDNVNTTKETLGAKPDIKLENACFSYTSKKFIENLNLFVPYGKRIAIVGPTGCGKTTIINLLMRFYELNKGKITFNDVDIIDVSRKDLRSYYGMVLQDTWLFKGTIRDNILFGLQNNSDISDQKLEEVCSNVHMDSFIKKLPNGYNTVISDNLSLSEGQKQLLCIARVMINIPPVLILDEATSSIDTLTEKYIQESFNRLMQGRTSFIIAHRFSTIQNADVILVMKDGKIIEKGKHSELINMNGFYAQLVSSQH